MASIRIVLIDDHVIVRSGLASYVEAEKDMEVVAQANGLEEAKACMQAVSAPDVAVVDLHLPDGSGIEFIQWAADAHPGLSTLTLSVNAGEMDVLAAVEAGTCGYLSKSAERRELIDAIRDIAQGNTYFPAAIRRKLELGATRPKLTEREQTILEQIVRGFSNKKIADNLDIAETTARQHVSSVLRKLNAQDRTQAAIIAVREGHIRIDPHHAAP